MKIGLRLQVHPATRALAGRFFFIYKNGWAGNARPLPQAKGVAGKIKIRPGDAKPSPASPAWVQFMIPPGLPLCRPPVTCLVAPPTPPLRDSAGVVVVLRQWLCLSWCGTVVVVGAVMMAPGVHDAATWGRVGKGQACPLVIGTACHSPN